MFIAAHTPRNCLEGCERNDLAELVSRLRGAAPGRWAKPQDQGVPNRCPSDPNKQQDSGLEPGDHVCSNEVKHKDNKYDS